MSRVQSLLTHLTEDLIDSGQSVTIEFENTQEHLQSLASALKGNALFSSISGLLFILFAPVVSLLFGSNPVVVSILRIIGIVLLVFAFQLYQGSKSKKNLVKFGYYGAINDIGWIIGTIVLLVVDTEITLGGKILMIGIGLVVANFAILQLHGITKIPISLKGTTIVNFPIDPVWQVISDVGGYDMYAKGITKVEMLDFTRAGKGMIRRCYDTRNLGWNEECTEFNVTDSYRSYTMNVDTSDYPYPFSIFRGTWTAKSLNNDKTRVSLQFTFLPKMWIIGRLLISPKVKSISETSIKQIFESYEVKIAELSS